MKVRAVIMGMMTAILPLLVNGHGYMSQPESRSYLCKTGQNQGCGAVQWEPQSVEGTDGFPEAGPADGEIASAGIAHFSELNQAGVNRWHRLDISTGWQDFSWHFTANHVTKDWRYFITKPGWDPELALTRDAFELAPFCYHSGNQQKPPVDLTHACYVPDNRQGYHVILGVWDVGDTTNSFYQVIDVNLQPAITDWKQVGNLHGQGELAVGTQIATRVFENSVENPALATSLIITTPEQGRNWSLLLAQKLNAEQSALQSGFLDANGRFVPKPGVNPVYARQNSEINAVELDIRPPQGIRLESVANRYPIVDTRARITFDAASTPAINAVARLIDSQGAERVAQNVSLNDTATRFELVLNDASPGDYVLQVAQVNGNLSAEANLQLTQSNQDYDQVFPQNLETYEAGTRVLHNNQIYQCKPFPASGYCKQWTPQATQFEPGVGSHWEMAWTLMP